MLSVTATKSRTPLKLLIAAIAVIGLMFSSACSSDSKSDGGTSTSNGKSSSADAGGKALPAAFDHVPAPEGYKKFDTIVEARSEDGSGTQLLFTIDPTVTRPSEEIMAEYTALLEKNGYTVEEDGGNMVATKGSTEVVFHSSMDGTITVAVVEI